MADCTNCGTWNPDDKDVCWRCQTKLPLPVEKKKKRPTVIFGLPLWTWIIVVLLFFAPLFSQCVVAPPAG